MQISLSDCGKRFNRDWIFRKFSRQFNSGNSYAITGPNGSGKSTLLQCIAGAVSASEGKVQYYIDNKIIEPDNAFKHLSIATPYQELIEEMTLVEFLAFHHKFKPFSDHLSIPDIISIIGLEKSSHKQIRYYSSGMKQRVKLAQAVLSDTPCILLDEPCTNLDIDGIELYHRMINNFCGDRLVVVSSNDKQEYDFCKEVISILDYKY
ncbi:MAG: ATP-binding cassette domain-containing protein [Chitinophagaceae bacterium]|nr:ATP-binding cassette domain-containing protein [Chitinophagaceae bacterium]